MISVVNVDIFQMEFIELCTCQKCIALIETAFGTNQTLLKRSRFHDTIHMHSMGQHAILVLIASASS